MLAAMLINNHEPNHMDNLPDNSFQLLDIWRLGFLRIQEYKIRIQGSFESVLQKIVQCYSLGWNIFEIKETWTIFCNTDSKLARIRKVYCWASNFKELSKYCARTFTQYRLVQRNPEFRFPYLLSASLQANTEIFIQDFFSPTCIVFMYRRSTH